MNGIKILDCTLRDGGYINNWQWGKEVARDIIATLSKASIDIVEVGFLRNVENYDVDNVCCNSIEELNCLLPSEKGKAIFSAMAMCSNYDINKLSDYAGQGIEIIRVTAHEYDIDAGIHFAEIVKSKGYKVCFNPINIMGYTDEQIIQIVKKVNSFNPYAFSIVDTFGSMTQKDVERIYSLVDNNLNINIKIGLHLHENRASSFFLAQDIIQRRSQREIIIDGSLMGMGRDPGNLQIELIADYLNEGNSVYDIDYMLDLIQDHIMNLKGKSKWGYSPAYFLSAKYNLHRNYAEYFLLKNTLTHREINHLLSVINNTQKAVFNEEYAEQLYRDYFNNEIDDAVARKRLQNEIGNRNVLILAPGGSISLYKHEIIEYITVNEPICMSVNFITQDLPCRIAFFDSSKRLDKFEELEKNVWVMVTSNVHTKRGYSVFDIKKIMEEKLEYSNVLVLLLNLLKQIGVSNISIAGADGFRNNTGNYYTSLIQESNFHDDKYNEYIRKFIKSYGVSVKFITPSIYSEEFGDSREGN